MPRIVVLVVIVANGLVGCGGNYSNEDLDFQTVLPERADLAVKLPQLVQEPPADASEYYRVSREVARLCNGLLIGTLGVIDAVRAYPATRREPRRRIWGPFLMERHPLWVSRLTIQMADRPEAPTGFRFEYQLEVKLARAGDDRWRTLVAGHYLPTGGARRGEGAFELRTIEPRDVGYPLDEFGELETVRVVYDTGAFPVTMIMELENRAGSSIPRARYTYREEASGAGHLLFAFPRADDIWASAIDIRTRWAPGGAGRADAVVTDGLAKGLRGVDCWDPSTRATFVHRDWAAEAERGEASSCLFDAPAP